VEDHAADQLDIEMPLAERAFGGLAHRGKSLRQDVFQGLALGQPFLEGGRHRPQFFVRFSDKTGLQGVDFRHIGPKPLQLAFVGRTEEAQRNRIEETPHSREKNPA